MMTPQMRSRHDAAIDNWNRALQTYRASVDLYGRVVEMQHRRGVHRLRTTTAPAALLNVAPPLPSPPALDELTAREREVALLIARGFSNHQIAQALVITDGTTANHVGHIMAKLGVANRIGVAAAVFAQGTGTDPPSSVEPIPLITRFTATANAKS